MKSFIISVVIGISIIVGSITFGMYIENMSEEMLDYSGEIKSEIESGDFEIADKKIDELSEFIEEKKIVLASTMNHEKLDKIEETIAELGAYSKSRQWHDALARCEALAFQLEHLPRDYMLKAENIL